MAFDWLKTILGDHYTDEIDKKVSDEIGRGFVAHVDFNAKNEHSMCLMKFHGRKQRKYWRLQT